VQVERQHYSDSPAKFTGEHRVLVTICSQVVCFTGNAAWHGKIDQADRAKERIAIRDNVPQVNRPAAHLRQAVEMMRCPDDCPTPLQETRSMIAVSPFQTARNDQDTAHVEPFLLRGKMHPRQTFL
jgi:hypothetical protein